MKKLINKIKEKKTTIIKFLIMLGILAAISCVTLAVLMLTGVLTYDKGFAFNTSMFNSFTGKWYGFIIFVLIQTVLSMLLCVIPGVAMALVMLSTVIYPDPIAAFLLSYFSVLVASAVLYTVGRIGGYRICEKMLGSEDCEKSLTLLRNRGTVYFPIMMLFPIFPDDALVMLAGTTKMRLSWFIPSIVLCRGIGAATIIFGLDLIPFDRFTGVYDWIILITLIFFWVREIFKLANKVDRYFEKKRKKQEDEAEENESILEEV